jgi:hypothetical protein
MIDHITELRRTIKDHYDTNNIGTLLRGSMIGSLQLKIIVEVWQTSNEIFLAVILLLSITHPSLFH